MILRHREPALGNGAKSAVHMNGASAVVRNKYVRAVDAHEEIAGNNCFRVVPDKRRSALAGTCTGPVPFQVTSLRSSVKRRCCSKPSRSSAVVSGSVRSVLPIIAAFDAMFVSFEMDFTKHSPAGQTSEDN